MKMLGIFLMFSVLFMSEVQAASEQQQNQNQQREVEVMTYNGQELLVIATDDTEARALQNASSKMIEYCYTHNSLDSDLKDCILQKNK